MRNRFADPECDRALAALGLEESLVGITHPCDQPPTLRTVRITSTLVPKDASSSEIDLIVKETAR